MALGAAAVVALKGTADLTNPKVLRGSMGALFRLPAVAADAEGSSRGPADAASQIWVAAADGEPLGRRAPTPRPPVALVVGTRARA